MADPFAFAAMPAPNAGAAASAYQQPPPQYQQQQQQQQRRLRTSRRCHAFGSHSLRHCARRRGHACSGDTVVTGRHQSAQDSVDRGLDGIQDLQAVFPEKEPPARHVQTIPDRATPPTDLRQGHSGTERADQPSGAAAAARSRRRRRRRRRRRPPNHDDRSGARFGRSLSPGNHPGGHFSRRPAGICAGLRCPGGRSRDARERRRNGPARFPGRDPRVRSQAVFLYHPVGL
mmetsp:Transcript_24166/g.57010  ORF Transcript_24166/g.57010 Transcript_24166/m.57010 type:complete len:231 (+) Transcript_24166:292-984(+)